MKPGVLARPQISKITPRSLPSCIHTFFCDYCDYQNPSFVWRNGRSGRLFQLSLSGFKPICSEIWPQNVSCSSLFQDAPHQPWRAPASLRHFLPSMGGWWSGHTDHNHTRRRAEGQSGDPGGLTIFSPTWCSFNFQHWLLLFATPHPRPPWCCCSSSTPAPPSPPRTSSKGSI